jgi:hypothetical protein
MNKGMLGFFILFWIPCCLADSPTTEEFLIQAKFVDGFLSTDSSVT